MSKQASKQSISDIISGYESKQRASKQGVRVYEHGKIFRLYLSKEQASKQGVSLNKQGFISLNKLNEQERASLKAIISELK